MPSQLLLFNLLCLSAIVFGKPSGSPICDATGGDFGHGPEDKNAGYSISATKENGSYKIQVSQSKSPFVGLLMYVTGADGKSHVGSFTPVDGFQFVSGCSGDSGSTITHSSATPKTASSFIWSPPSGASGPFKIEAIVTGGKNPWQRVIYEIEESPASTAVPTETPVAVPTATSAAEPVVSPVPHPVVSPVPHPVATYIKDPRSRKPKPTKTKHQGRPTKCRLLRKYLTHQRKTHDRKKNDDKKI